MLSETKLTTLSKKKISKVSPDELSFGDSNPKIRVRSVKAFEKYQGI